ncbi:MAG: ATP-binding domain-containing protein [Rhodocyclaceae bacterium]
MKFLTMHSCEGLEFPLVAIPGVGLLGEQADRKDEDARLLYVAMTRATRELVVVGA